MELKSVTKAEFYARLGAEPRDVMPTHHEPERTVWYVVRTRELWAIETPGWRNPDGPQSFNVAVGLATPKDALRAELEQLRAAKEG